MQLPRLKYIGGDLNCQGNKQMTENSFPALEYIGGDIILAGSGFTKLPASLKTVAGRGIISKTDPISLLKAMQEAVEKGIIKGGIFYCD